MITSVTNQRIKDMVKLRESLSRRQKKLFIIEGCREISLALDAHIDIKDLYVCREFIKENMGKNIIALAQKQKINVCEVSCNVYEKMAYGQRREGFIAVARQPEYRLTDIQLSKNPLLVVTDSLEKPGNIGAILRTIDAANCDGLIITDPKTDIYNHNVIRASIGTIFTKPVITASPEAAREWLKKNHINIVIAHLGGSTNYTKVDFTKPTAIIVGSEEKGVSSFWQNHADALARIPMQGKADSLNVSAAAAIFIFEALRQRG